MGPAWLVVAAALAGLAAGRLTRAFVVRYWQARDPPPLPSAGQPGTGQPGTEQPGAARAGAADERAGQGRAEDGGPAAAPPGHPPPRLLVEGVTAAVLGLLASGLGLSPVLPALCWLGVCGVPLAFIDARTRRLPDLLTAPAWAGTLVLLIPAAAAGDHWAWLLRALAGGGVLAACFLALALASGGAVGLGDVKLAASAGTALAWFGWRVLISGVFAGLLLAAVYGLGLLTARRARLGQQIAFGPFLLAGTLAATMAAAVGALG